MAWRGTALSLPCIRKRIQNFETCICFRPQLTDRNPNTVLSFNTTRWTKPRNQVSLSFIYHCQHCSELNHNDSGHALWQWPNRGHRSYRHPRYVQKYGTLPHYTSQRTVIAVSQTLATLIVCSLHFLPFNATHSRQT